MFEKFTDKARRVVVLAQEEAKLLNHNYIGTEHILLGLIHEGEGVAAKSLESLGISLESVREQVQVEWIQLSSALTRLPSLLQSQASARLTAEAWDRQFLAGRKSWMEVMNTVREMLQADLDLVDAQTQILLGSWRLACLVETPEMALNKMQQVGAARP